MGVLDVLLRAPLLRCMGSRREGVVVLSPMYVWLWSSNIKLHDPEAHNQPFSVRYKNQLVQYQLTKHTNNLDILQDELEVAARSLDDITHTDLLSAIATKLQELRDYKQTICNTRITSKLNKLYQGHLMTPTDNNNFINLSTHPINEKTNNLLSLGFKCHYKPKFDPITKQMELEILYSKILDMHEKGTVNIHSNLRDQLRAEATKNLD